MMRIYKTRSTSMLSYKTRRIQRNERICWLNSTSQLWNTIPWPQCFYDYERQEQDVFASTFNLITELGSYNKNYNIAASHCNVAAQNFIDYVNSEKQKVPAENQTTADRPWHIKREQDAQECINYFLVCLLI